MSSGMNITCMSSIYSSFIFSNPVMEITRYIVSSSPSGEDGIIRNNKHDDLLCPYDMQDGWEVKDEDTNSWVEDKTLTVNCVKS